MNHARALLLAALMALPLQVEADELPLPPVHEGWGSLQVKATAPLPQEVVNETQAQALAREAAIVRGQTALLTYVLQKRTRSRKTLAEAEIPSLQLQEHIRGYIKGAKAVRTMWAPLECTVTLVLDKSELKSILRKN